jgi:hypothetical protein
VKLRKLLHYVAALGPAVLRLVGVKKNTVAADVVEVAQEADKVLPPEGDAKK